MSEKELSTEEINERTKAATAAGFTNQMIAGNNATAEEAVALYKASDEKAVKLIKKAQLIRESILSEVSNKTEEEKSASELPENLKTAVEKSGIQISRHIGEYNGFTFERLNGDRVSLVGREGVVCNL